MFDGCNEAKKQRHEKVPAFLQRVCARKTGSTSIERVRLIYFRFYVHFYLILFCFFYSLGDVSEELNPGVQTVMERVSVDAEAF